MSPQPFFVIQFLWFLAAWATVGALLVTPAISGLRRDDVLCVWTAPQLFRVLGIGLLVPSLSPNMPPSFAVPTAIGDSLTACLALISIIGLRRRWGAARRLAWACNIVGIADLAIAVPHAAMIGAVRFLAAQWYVPALGVPLMIVSHIMALRTLAGNHGSK